jgi:two-component system chemotaxis response regulator CheB
MPHRDVIVVGASAGGVEALRELVGGFPPDLPAALFVVLHIPPSASSALPTILDRAGSLRAVQAHDGEPIRQGTVYVAPPDRHLLVQDGLVRLSRGARENGSRPAVDPLFRSAARSYGPRVVGVILSGTLDDGTAGLQMVKAHGGLAVVQNPNDALFGGMPASAIENVEVDYCLPVHEIPALLARLTMEPAPEKGVMIVAEEPTRQGDGKEQFEAFTASDKQPGRPSLYTCPECHGTLWELEEGQFAHYRCRTGHQFSPESLLDAQSESLEDALWGALRALEEKASLARRLSLRARERAHGLAAARFESQAEDAERSVEIIRSVLTNGTTTERGTMTEPGQSAGESAG